jgi:hypothetical protein
MLRYCVVSLIVLAVGGQAHAQSIAVSTVTPTKGKIDVTGTYLLNNKAYGGGR